MTSVQKTITFPAKKRFLTRFQAKHDGKENDPTVNDQENNSSSKEKSVKRSSNGKDLISYSKLFLFTIQFI